MISHDKLDIYKKKHVYIIDNVQKNYIFFRFSTKLKIWIEYLIPFSNKSSVYNYSLKKKNNVHHYGFLTKNLNKKKKEMTNNGFILLGKYRINVPCFGGFVETSFFHNGNNLIEILSNEKK